MERRFCSFCSERFLSNWNLLNDPQSSKESNFLLGNLLSLGWFKICLCEEWHCCPFCRFMMGPPSIILLLQHTVVQILLLLHPLAVQWQSSSSQIRLWLEKAFFWSGMQWMLLLLHAPLLKVGFQLVTWLKVIQPVIFWALLKLQTNIPAKESPFLLGKGKAFIDFLIKHLNSFLKQCIGTLGYTGLQRLKILHVAKEAFFFTQVFHDS